MRIIFATGNNNKMREIREILGGLGMEILSMKEAGVSGDIVEDGTSFAENSMIKAKDVPDKTLEMVRQIGELKQESLVDKSTSKRV